MNVTNVPWWRETRYNMTSIWIAAFRHQPEDVSFSMPAKVRCYTRSSLVQAVTSNLLKIIQGRVHVFQCPSLSFKKEKLKSGDSSSLRVIDSTDVHVEDVLSWARTDGLHIDECIFLHGCAQTDRLNPTVNEYDSLFAKVAQLWRPPLIDLIPKMSYCLRVLLKSVLWFVSK